MTTDIKATCLDCNTDCSLTADAVIVINTPGRPILYTFRCSCGAQNVKPLPSEMVAVLTRCGCRKVVVVPEQRTTAPLFTEDDLINLGLLLERTPYVAVLAAR